MIENKETIILKDGMDHVLQQLNALHGMIGVLKSGLESEEAEKQALDCMECINECLNNIRTFVIYSLKEFEEYVKEKE